LDPYLVYKLSITNGASVGSNGSRSFLHLWAFKYLLMGAVVNVGIVPILHSEAIACF